MDFGVTQPIHQLKQKQGPPHCCNEHNCFVCTGVWHHRTSKAFWAKVSETSPWKLFILVILICIYRIKVQVCLDSPDYNKPEFLTVGQISTAGNFGQVISPAFSRK